jgi:hypothetical protein
MTIPFDLILKGQNDELTGAEGRQALGVRFRVKASRFIGTPSPQTRT